MTHASLVHEKNRDFAVPRPLVGEGICCMLLRRRESKEEEEEKTGKCRDTVSQT